MNTTKKKQTQANKKIPLSEIELNEGQLNGLPSNPRFIKDEKSASLVRSLQESPEFLKARPLLVYQMKNGKYITIAGNMRLRALRELGAKDVPCYVFPKEGLKRICNDEAKAERLRFVCADKFRSIIGGSLAFSGAKMPLDFPADLARSLINEFCKECGAVLDPCAGWGGRLVGFLASHASTHSGTDASPEQIKGGDLIWRTFQGFTEHEKAVTLNCIPFEKTTLQNESFDFAITSPPYFDTEKYMGGEQSRETNGSYQEWRENFYRVLIEKVFAALKRNTFFCLQIGSQRYPLLEDGKQIATEIGFEVVEVRPTDMKNNYNKTEEERGEVVIILSKP